MKQRSPLFYIFRLLFLILGFFIVRAIWLRYTQPKTENKIEPKQERPKWPSN